MRVCFGPFVLDLETRQLTQEGRERHLSPKAFELLTVLVADRPKVLSKATLYHQLWPDTFVLDANLANLVAEVRSALDDDARTPQFVRTAHRLGYAFCGTAVTIAHTSAADADSPTCWLEWGARRFPLPAGEHVVGRDPDVAVSLDSSTVSRRHARVVVTAVGSIVEDLQSRNGTFRGDERVTTPVGLADGDAIRVGSLLLTFHVRTTCATTDVIASP